MSEAASRLWSPTDSVGHQPAICVPHSEPTRHCWWPQDAAIPTLNCRRGSEARRSRLSGLVGETADFCEIVDWLSVATRLIYNARD